MMDRGYTNLLSYLNRPSTVILLQSLTSSLAHYLSFTPPTSLTATAVSSPFFAPPLSYKNLSALSIAFRHAVHHKYKALTDDTSSPFTRGVKVKLRDWVADLLKGLEGGMSVLRLACAGGVLSGFDDLERVGKLKMGQGEAGKGWVEDEVLVALMEVMELYEPGGWEKEFQPATDDVETVNMLSLALILASQSIPLIQESKLIALPLPTLAHHLISTITSAFQSGSFLDSFPRSITQKDGYRIYISPLSPVPSTLTALLASLTYESLPSVSKITARVLSTLIESKPVTGLLAAGQTLGVLEGLAGHVEEAWIKSGLEDTEESDIEPDSREVTTKIWTVFKTLLFTTIMISEAVLSTTVFVPPVSFSPSPTPHLTPFSPSNQPTPKTLSLQTLQTLSHLSFVISQFGGITTTSTSDFPELKKTFYIALDILSSGGGLEGEKLVRRLCAEDTHHTTGENHGYLRQTKKAFTLACTEQLVPILKEESLPIVFQACFPHLSDPSHRETFESAHSVMLGIFAAHAQSVTGTKMNSKQFVSETVSAGSTSRRGFVETLVPFYAGCLIENSVSGRLSTSQLRLAYSALVRSASSGTYISSLSSLDADAFALAQFCINTLLSVIHESSPPSMPSWPSVDQDHTHRLHLTLISTLPSLPSPLLPRTLTCIRSIVLSLPLNMDGDERRKELLEELFGEILKVGDREKDVVMRWWYDVREEMIKGVKEEVKGSERDVVSSRL